MITLALRDQNHYCLDPRLSLGTSMLNAGSLWECDSCGREWIKMRDNGGWQPTVKVIQKELM